jgi:hypothetical protein
VQVPVTVLSDTSRVLVLRLSVTVRTPERSLGAVNMFLDGRLIGGIGGSDSGNRELTASTSLFSEDLKANSVLTPSRQELTVVVRPRFNFVGGSILSAEPRPHVEVIDRDSGEVVRLLNLETQQMTLTGESSVTFRWPISIPESLFARGSGLL